jgi:hypothetical protein
VPRTRKTEYGNTMLFQAAYSGEPAGIPGERIHARLCGLCVGRKDVGDLSGMQIQEGGQTFSVKPELKMCTCSTHEQQIVRTCNTDGSAPVGSIGSKG